MRFKESETIDLKSTVTDDLKKEILAFANTEGGSIYNVGWAFPSAAMKSWLMSSIGWN